ncbi:MAG TPA: Asp-tRNA(Asn)/Glu-tRNA(Gln) amidotransferase GatCAB subunit B, partial [Candidatus Methylomirabilis sp.]
MPEFEAVIGLDVHAELLTRSKMFCGCSTKFGEPPNTQTCPICLGMPGVLPVINRRAVEYAIKTALALDCTIARRSIFARKNYYYPDLPKAYQISQYELPLSEHGSIA